MSRPTSPLQPRERPRITHRRKRWGRGCQPPPSSFYPQTPKDCSCSSCATHGRARILPHLGCSSYPADRPPTRPLRMPRPGASAAGGLSSRASPRQPTTARKRLQGLTDNLFPPTRMVFFLLFLGDMILIGRIKQFWVATYFARVSIPCQFLIPILFCSSPCNVCCGLWHWHLGYTSSVLPFGI